MLAEIDGVDADRLLNTTDDDWCAYLVGEYTIEVPILDESAITVDQTEARIDVSQDRNRAIFDRGRPFHIAGTAVTFHVPFIGDAELFRCRASTYSLNPPRASVQGREVDFVYERTDHEPEALKRAFDTDLASVQQHLGYIRNDVDPFNARLESTARARLGSRRQKLLADRGLVASLGFPLRERAGEHRTYVAPDVRRKLPPPKPPAGTPPFAPEPELSMEHYEHILSVVSNMVVVMERSPAAFRTMSEEDIRQHFLVQLNGQYEGQATGETFNFEGKTDIVIRSGAGTSSSPSARSGRARRASRKRSISCSDTQPGVVALLELGLAELQLDRCELASQDADQEVPAPARRLQDPRVDPRGLLPDQIEHRLDHPVGREDLTVVGNALLRLHQLGSVGGVADRRRPLPRCHVGIVSLATRPVCEFDLVCAGTRRASPERTVRSFVRPGGEARHAGPRETSE